MNPLLRQLKLAARDAQYAARRLGWPVRHRSAAENVYHCGTHKSASTWFKRVLSDRRLYEASGLAVRSYHSRLGEGVDRRRLAERDITRPFPARAIISPLYFGYQNYLRMPKPDTARAFFVLRDPRDMVVSALKMRLHSQKYRARNPERVAKLERMSPSEQLRQVIKGFGKEGGFFDAQTSWLDSSADPSVMMIRYEEFITDAKLGIFVCLFAHCDIALARDEIAALLDDYSFQRMTGRAQGQEDSKSHLRKGVAGDWRNHFDAACVQAFKDSTGDMLIRMGYESNMDWSAQ